MTPDGGHTDWHYDEDGNLVSDAGDNAQTLADFKGISISAAQNIISAEGFITDYNNGLGTDLLGEQVAYNRGFGSPYKLNQKFRFNDWSVGGTAKGWNAFLKKGIGMQAMGSNFQADAIVRHNGEFHYLEVEGFVRSDNHPSNNYDNNISYKLSSDKSMQLANETLKFERLREQLTLKGISYVGGKLILLPNNPKEFSMLKILLSVHRETELNSISTSLEVNLLKHIVY